MVSITAESGSSSPTRGAQLLRLTLSVPTSVDYVPHTSFQPLLIVQVREMSIASFLLLSGNSAAGSGHEPIGCSPSLLMSKGEETSSVDAGGTAEMVCREYEAA